MAKSSMKAREDKRAKTVAKFAVKRDAIKVILNDVNTSDEDRWDAQMALQKLPRNASPVRQMRRCQITGRPHAVSASSAYHVSSFVKLRCVVMYQALKRLLGKKVGCEVFDFVASF